MQKWLLIFAVTLLTGCVNTNSLYYWGNYEESLFAYTKRPGDLDKYVSSLGEIISKGEELDQVPPGLYAEYGHALLTAGREAEAMSYFEKEKANWPESEKLMDMMINGQAIAQSDTKERVSTEAITGLPDDTSVTQRADQ